MNLLEKIEHLEYARKVLDKEMNTLRKARIDNRKFEDVSLACTRFLDKIGRDEGYTSLYALTSLIRLVPFDFGVEMFTYDCNSHTKIEITVEEAFPEFTEEEEGAIVNFGLSVITVVFGSDKITIDSEGFYLEDYEKDIMISWILTYTNLMSIEDYNIELEDYLKVRREKYGC